MRRLSWGAVPRPFRSGLLAFSPLMNADHDDHDDRADFDRASKTTAPAKSSSSATWTRCRRWAKNCSRCPEKRVAALDLPESLLDAIKEGRRIVAGTARSGEAPPAADRQAHAPGRSRTDPRGGRASSSSVARRTRSKLHQAERWRVRLRVERRQRCRRASSTPSTRSIPQQLRGLIRAARKDTRPERRAAHGSSAWREA